MARRPFESKVQDLVYNIDTGVGLRLIQVGLALLFLLMIMLVFTATQFRGLKDAQAMDAAQVGRNLMTYRAYVTQNVRPASMHYLKARRGDARVGRHPELIQPPGYPLLLAGGFRALRGAFASDKPSGVYRPEQWIIVPLNHLFTLLTGLLTFFIGRRLFSFRIAAIGTTVFFLSRTAWEDSIAGIGLPVVSFLGAAAFYAALRACDRRQDGARPAAWLVPLALAAVASAAAVLTRYGAVVLVPGVMLYLALALGPRGWRCTRR